MRLKIQHWVVSLIWAGALGWVPPWVQEQRDTSCAEVTKRLGNGLFLHEVAQFPRPALVSSKGASLWAPYLRFCDLPCCQPGDRAPSPCTFEGQFIPRGQQQKHEHTGLLRSLLQRCFSLPASIFLQAPARPTDSQSHLSPSAYFAWLLHTSAEHDSVCQPDTTLELRFRGADQTHWHPWRTASDTRDQRPQLLQGAVYASPLSSSSQSSSLCLESTLSPSITESLCRLLLSL